MKLFMVNILKVMEHIKDRNHALSTLPDTQQVLTKHLRNRLVEHARARAPEVQTLVLLLRFLEIS